MKNGRGGVIVLHQLTDGEVRLLWLLFPQLAALDLGQVEDLDGGVQITARTRGDVVACHICGTPSVRMHDRYRRRLQDLSCGERPVRIKLEVRRFICDNAACGVATFAEQVPGLTTQQQRRTVALRGRLERVALALAGRAGSRLARVLGDYKPHLHERWNSGCTTIQQLHREITALGFRGSYGTVYAYLAPFKGSVAPPAVPAPPKVRHITSWIRRHPDNLDPDDQLKLEEVLAACAHLTALHGHVKTFAEMMTGRHGDRLDAWIAVVRADDLPHLHSFANGLERDHAAVLAGLTLPHSSGAVEGKVCKIKFLKRLMFGRASYDLLRKMALLN